MLGFTQSEKVRGAGEEDRRVCVSTFSSEWAFCVEGGREGARN